MEEWKEYKLEEIGAIVGAATRLRGQIDAAGYKEYILGLLFFPLKINS